jgi:hypothetical protein
MNDEINGTTWLRSAQFPVRLLANDKIFIPEIAYRYCFDALGKAAEQLWNCGHFGQHTCDSSVVIMFTKTIVFALAMVVSFLCVCYSKEQGGKVMKEDLPHIACDVCERTVAEIFQAVELARSNKPKRIIDELEILEIIESVSNPTNVTGEWMRRIDIIEATVKDKRYLSFIEPGGTSKCKNECHTIAKSCEMLLHEEVDADELSTLLWKNKAPLAELQVQRSSNTHAHLCGCHVSLTSHSYFLQSKVCTKMTRRCRPKRKELPAKYVRVDEEFVAMSEKDLEMERLMANMRAMGMGGSLYNRDDLGDMMGMDADDMGADEL